MKINGKIAICFVFCTSWVNQSVGYEIPNHADMTREAALLSILAKQTGPSGKAFRLGLRPRDIDDPLQTFPLAPSPEIGICYGIQVDPITGQPIVVNGKLVPDTANQPPWGQDAGRTQMTIAQLFRYGACYEDNEGPVPLTDQRPLAHFYDPQHQGRGLTNALIGPVPSSLEWMLKPAATSDGTGTNHYGWSDARDAFYDAITFNSNIASVNAADNALLRKLKWAKTFQSLGHITHHLQDMAQPQHVRNDDHCDATACVGPVDKPSGYEKHMLNNRLSFVRTLAQSASAPILFGLPREFWNMNTDNALQTLNPAQAASADTGLAAYTSTNFVSAGTDFRLRGSNELRALLSAADYGLPAPSGQWDDVSLATLYANTPGGVPSVFRDVLCAGDASACKMRFMGTSTNPSAKTSSVSIFAPEMFNPANAFTGDREGVFQQNYFTYDDAASKLIPKAVEYSAGLIDYFFRGEMEISLPEEGVYGVVDHAVEKTKGTDGFRLIKLKLKNTTPAINSTRGVIAQNMTNGEFRAIAKFRRNTCYTADLKGQIGTVGQGASPRVNEVAACRSAVDEIVVSAPSTDATALDAGTTKTLSFDFSANPVPIEATDLFIQVVFKGTLGEELGAVAVGTKDVSEPSFVSLLESSDYRLCAASWVNASPDPFDEVGCARWNPDAGDSPIVQPELSDPDGWRFRAWKTPEYGRWFGFHGAQNKNVVVARLPDGLPPGSYVRLGVIAAADNQPLILSYGGATNSNLPFTRRLAQGEFAVDDTEYWRSITYVKKTLVQADDEGVIDPQSLPKYWQARSVVLAAMTVWPGGDDAKSLLPALAIYRGEPLWSTPVNEFLNGVTSQAANVSVLSGDYYPAITGAPQAFDRIAFAAGSPNQVPATWQSIKREPLNNIEGEALWAFFSPRFFNGRHRMTPRAAELKGFVDVLRP